MDTFISSVAIIIAAITLLFITNHTRHILNTKTRLAKYNQWEKKIKIKARYNDKLLPKNLKNIDIEYNSKLGLIRFDLIGRSGVHNVQTFTVEYAKREGIVDFQAIVDNVDLTMFKDDDTELSNS